MGSLIWLDSNHSQCEHTRVSPAGGVFMSNLALDVQARLGLEHAPVGFRYVDQAPPTARRLGSGAGCIAPLVRAAARGATFALTREACGWPCAAFHLGFSTAIFPGIERFLSHGPLPGRDCERFLLTASVARDYLDAMRFEAPAGRLAVLAPLASFGPHERPDLAIILANADQLSGLVFLLHHDAPTDDRRVVTQFASACASMITLPLRAAREGSRSAVWGLHDISARARLPADLMSLAMPHGVLEAAWRHAPDSFLATERWRRLLGRGVRGMAGPGD